MVIWRHDANFSPKSGVYYASGTSLSAPSVYVTGRTTRSRKRSSVSNPTNNDLSHEEEATTAENFGAGALGGAALGAVGSLAVLSGAALPVLVVGPALGGIFGGAAAVALGAFTDRTHDRAPAPKQKVQERTPRSAGALDADDLRLVDQVAVLGHPVDRLAYGGFRGLWVTRITVFCVASTVPPACWTIDSSEISLSAMRLAIAAKTPMRSCTVKRMK